MTTHGNFAEPSMMTAPEAENYLDSPEFKDYAAAIEFIVHAVKPIKLEDGNFEPGRINIRSIHQQLGDRMRREWTIDALESLSSIEYLPSYVDHWRRREHEPPRYAKRWNGDAMRWLFGKNPDREIFARLGIQPVERYRSGKRRELQI